jgi:membrane associated rhomboid family serine protease
MSVMHKPAGEQYLLTYASLRKFFPPVTTAILAIQVGLYIAGSITAETRLAVGTWLGASASGTLGEGRVWQLLTYVLVEPVGLFLLLNALALITIASRLERVWGRVWYLLFWGLMAMVTVVPFLALGANGIVGCYSVELGAIAAFGWVFRRQQAFLFTYRIPVPVYIGAALAILALLAIQYGIFNLLWFLAALWGFLYAKLMESIEHQRAYVRLKPQKKAARHKEGRFKELDLGD